MADESNIGLIVPCFEELPAFYQAADRMGFHSLWVTETLFNRTREGGRGPDDFGVLAAAAAVTSRIRLGTAPLGNSASILSLAGKTANIDHLSGGRLSLGLSQGAWPDEGVGERRRPRVGGRLRETITLLKRLWSESEVTFKGSHNNLGKASIDVRPVQASGIPILVGGVTGASVNLAATLADGWVHPSGGVPGGAVRGCDMVRRLASIAGRNPDSIELGKIIYLSIDDNRNRARDRIAPLLGLRYRGGYNVDDWCAFGPPIECAHFIRGFLDVGITTVMLCMIPPDVEQLERLHREVMPLLK